MNKYIDLHLHLDGAFTVEIAKKLAEMQNITLPTYDDNELKKLLTVPEDCKSLNEFLNCFELPGKLIQTYEGVRESVFLVMEQAKKEGVVYAEVRYAPQKSANGNFTQEDTIRAALEGLKKSSLKGNLVLCCMRGGTEKDNKETVELAKKYLVKDGGVVGIDIAGAEALYPTADYKDLFALAKSYNIPFTIHAGEADGAESVKLAVEYGAKRIGHGVRIAGNKEVMDLVKNKGVYLEMCPTSNCQTKAIDCIDNYPILDFLNYGIKVTINTDDPAIEGTTMAKEYELIKQKFGLTKKQENQIIENTIDGAFTSNEVKKLLKTELGIINESNLIK